MKERPLPSPSGLSKPDFELDDRDPRRGWLASSTERRVFRAVAAGSAVWVHFRGRTYRLDAAAEKEAGGAEEKTTELGEAIVRSPMPGIVLSVKVRKGDWVEDGTLLFTLEAMKMEHEVRAGAAGTIAQIHVAQGERVEKEAPLAEIRP